MSATWRVGVSVESGWRRPGFAASCLRYAFGMPGEPHPSESTPSEADDDRALLVAVAQGLADDAAGRVMSTETLKESLERELGPISWP